MTTSSQDQQRLSSHDQNTTLTAAAANVPDDGSIRVSVQTPNTPRFLLSFIPKNFPTIKAFVLFLCQESGLLEQ